MRFMRIKNEGHDEMVIEKKEKGKGKEDVEHLKLKKHHPKSSNPSP